FAALRPQVEVDCRAVPLSRGVGRDRLPADTDRRLELVDSHYGDALALIEAELARSADPRIEDGVARPPVANAFRCRERLVDPLGRRVDADEMHDVGHVPFLSRRARHDRTPPSGGASNRKHILTVSQYLRKGQDECPWAARGPGWRRLTPLPCG